jgi:hypothetical protein
MQGRQGSVDDRSGVVGRTVVKDQDLWRFNAIGRINRLRVLMCHGGDYWRYC